MMIFLLLDLVRTQAIHSKKLVVDFPEIRDPIFVVQSVENIQFLGRMGITLKSHEQMKGVQKLTLRQAISPETNGHRI